MKTSATTYCEHCEALVEPDSKFCAQCGNKLHEASANRSQVQPETPPREGGRRSTNNSTPLAVVGICILAVLVGSGLFFAAYKSSSASAPTQDQVKRDCDQIAAATIYLEYLPGGEFQMDRYTGKKLPLLLCSEVKITGTSVDGKMADVLADVTVKYTLDARFGSLTEDGSGFQNWLQGRDYSWLDGFRSTRPRKGDTRLYRVTFKYRQFDTGWRLEGYK